MGEFLHWDCSGGSLAEKVHVKRGTPAEVMNDLVHGVLYGITEALAQELGRIEFISVVIILEDRTMAFALALDLADGLLGDVFSDLKEPIALEPLHDQPV